MNGAQSLIQTLVNGGVEVCFVNPGTSEMHFVAALDTIDGIRPVLGLFEGVCTGAADGYARMAGKPASTLLHLGPGLGNGIANLHNARRANSPVVNIVGEHTTYHRQHDPPLAADIEALAGAVSGWVHTSRNAAGVPSDAAAAVAAAMRPPGQVATLILPADCSWNASIGPAPVPDAPRPATVSQQTITRIAGVLQRREPTVLLLAGPAMLAQGSWAAGRIVRATGARIIGIRENGRTQRGAGRVNIQRLPYPVEPALELLAGAAHLILVGARPPVSFFAWPDTPNWLTPANCRIHTLAAAEEDGVGALEALAEELDAPLTPEGVNSLNRPDLPTGEISAEKVWTALAALMPEGAIISDEGVTSSRAADPWTAETPPHDWLNVTGGAIGQGLPLATGAAIACPDRKVFAMQADGAGMYTLQALWTQARERLDVVTVVFANRSYRILQGELERVGIDRIGPKTRRMLDLGSPHLDWVLLAGGMGVPATRASTAGQFNTQLEAAIHTPGPRLIEVVL